MLAHVHPAPCRASAHAHVARCASAMHVLWRMARILMAAVRMSQLLVAYCNAVLALVEVSLMIQASVGLVGACTYAEAMAGNNHVYPVQAEFDSLPCTEATPSCGATCDKTLPCGAHACEDRCHHGPCPSTCRAMITKSCECGRMQKDVPCYESVR